MSLQRAVAADSSSLPAGEVFKQLRHLSYAHRQPTWRPRAAVMAGQVWPSATSLTIAASSGCHPPAGCSSRDATPLDAAVAAAAGAAAVAVAGGTSSLSCFFLFLTFCFFSLTVGESSESASVAPSRNLAGMPACRRGGRADREGSGGLAIIVAKYNRAPGNRDVAGRRVRVQSLRFLTHPDVKN